MRSVLRAWLACAWMLGALLVAGCGPGVGGTGTGDAAFAAFGASAAPVCGGTVAAALACPAAPPVGPVPPGGTLPVQFVDAAGQVVLELNGNFAQLDASCQHLHFTGEFGTSANSSQGFFGSYEINGNGVDVLAALSTTPVVGGGALTIELRDVGGQAIVGPVLLQRTTGPLPAPGSC